VKSMVWTGDDQAPKLVGETARTAACSDGPSTRSLTAVPDPCVRQEPLGRLTTRMCRERQHGICRVARRALAMAGRGRRVEVGASEPCGVSDQRFADEAESRRCVRSLLPDMTTCCPHGMPPRDDRTGRFVGPTILCRQRTLWQCSISWALLVDRRLCYGRPISGSPATARDCLTR